MEPYSVETGNNFLLFVQSFDMYTEPVDINTSTQRVYLAILSPRCDVLYTFHAICNDRNESISEKRGGP
jgi:hypothetical protein